MGDETRVARRLKRDINGKYVTLVLNIASDDFNKLSLLIVYSMIHECSALSDCLEGMSTAIISCYKIVSKSGDKIGWNYRHWDFFEDVRVSLLKYQMAGN
jgi:hypothetical protein